MLGGGLLLMEPNKAPQVPTATTCPALETAHIRCLGLGLSVAPFQLPTKY